MIIFQFSLHGDNYGVLGILTGAHLFFKIDALFLMTHFQRRRLFSFPFVDTYFLYLKKAVP